MRAGDGGDGWFMAIITSVGPYIAITHGNRNGDNFLPFLWEWNHPLKNPNNNQPPPAGIRLEAGDAIDGGGRGRLLLSLSSVS